MTRFLHWRKMTWAIVLWSAGMLVWLLVTALVAPTAAEVAAGCATDSAGFTNNFLTQRDCINASTGIDLQLAVVGLAGILGLGLLTVIWFLSRPLWRQGHGARLRRIRSEPTVWAPKIFASPGAGSGGSA